MTHPADPEECSATRVAEHILTHPREWGARLSPEQCQWLADNLIRLRDLIEAARPAGETGGDLYDTGA